MKCFKMFGLLFASLAMLAMVGCGGGGGGGSHNTNQNTTVAVLVPLPTGGSASMRTSMRAVAADKFKAYYLNSAGKQVTATSISGLDTATATVAFADVPPGNDLVITTELDNGNGFKSYYKGLVKKADLAGGQLSKKINAETTAKAMLFEAKKKTTSTLSVADFEYTLKQEENKGNDIWTILGVTSTAMEKYLKDLTVEKNVATAVETAANSLVITPESDTPTSPSYPDETIKMLATADGWVEASADADSKLTGLSYAVNLLYSTEDGLTYKNRKEEANYIIKCDPYGGSHPYGLYKDGSYAGRNYKFEYLKDSKKFKYIFPNSESGVETTSEYKIEKLVKDNITYYRAINTDSSKKDVYYFKLASADGYDEEGLTSEFINLNWKSLPSLDDLGSVEGFEGTDYVYDGHFTALHDNDVVKIVAEGELNDKNVRKWTVIAENERDNYKFIDNFYFIHIDNSEFNAKMYCSIFFSEVGGRNLSWYSAVKDSSNYIFFKVTDGVADVVYSATQHDYPQNLATLQVYVAKDDAGHIYAKLIDKASNKSRILRIYSK